MRTCVKKKELWLICIIGVVIVIIGLASRPKKERPMRDIAIEAIQNRKVNLKRLSVLFNDEYIVCEERNDMWPHWVDNYYIISRVKRAAGDSLIVFDKQRPFEYFCDSLKIQLKYEY